MTTKAFVIVAVIVLALVAAAIVMHRPGADAGLMRSVHGSR
jgi:hypothetical protein